MPTRRKACNDCRARLRQHRTRNPALDTVWQPGGRKLCLDLLGLALWWAEGGKRRDTVSFTNIDPDAVSLFVQWLREVHAVPRRKLRVLIHVHSDLNPTLAMQFWSTVTGIPLKQFGKPYVIPRRPTSRKYRLWNGVCTVRVYDTALFDYLRERLGRLRLLTNDYRRRFPDLEYDPASFDPGVVRSKRYVGSQRPA